MADLKAVIIHFLDLPNEVCWEKNSTFAMMFYFFSTGYLPLQELHNTCKRFNVPAKHDLLAAVLQKVERNDRNEANYEQFLQLLNWRDSPGE